MIKKDMNMTVPNAMTYLEVNQVSTNIKYYNHPIVIKIILNKKIKIKDKINNTKNESKSQTTLQGLHISLLR